jgi:hypothetical protein
MTKKTIEFVHAKSKETQCHAFGKTDVRRCRLECEPGKKTCQVHRNYYLYWFDTHPPFIDGDKPLTNRKYEEYRFQIQEGHVQITKEYLDSLPLNAFPYYAFILLHTDISPSISKRLLGSYMIELLKPAYSDTVETLSGPFKSSIEHALTLLLRDHKSCIYVFECIVKFVFKYTILEYAFGITNNALDYVLTVLLLNNPLWSQVLHSSLLQTIYAFECKTFKEGYPEDSTYKQLLHTVIDPCMNPFLKLFHTIHKSRLEDTIRPIKEELIAEACHPKRLHFLLEKGHTIDDIFEGMGWD